MTQVGPENKEILGHFREHSKDVSLLSNHCLLSYGYHATWYETGQIDMWALQILSISLTDKTLLSDLFSKTKFNKVKEQCSLDGLDLFSNYNF